MGQDQGGVVATLDRVNEPRTASQVLGRTLRGRYRVLEPISAGAMGAVYRAIDIENDAEVALKQCTNPHHDQRFEAEARLLSALAHPRVVRIIDHFGVSSGQYLFMAPEVFAGGNVSARTDVFSVAATLWTLIAGRPPVYADPTKLSSVAPDVTPELESIIAAGLEMIPERRVASVAAFAKALGAPLRTETGISLAVSIDDPEASRGLMEAIVHTAAGVFGAAAASISLIDQTTGELVYQSAWGAGARDIVGVRLPPGAGIAGGVVQTGVPAAIPDCRADSRFAASIAAGTGYVPYTMLVVPLLRGDRAIGALSVLDRRDGRSYAEDDLEPAALFASLAVKALDVTPMSFTSLGLTGLS